MTDFLQHELTTIAFFWRLRRRDGVCLGFTTHDRDLAIGGLVYRAAPGMAPSAVSLSDGFEADTMDVAGALTSDAITSADLEAGRWDAAEVRLFVVDWSDPAGDTLFLARGELGDVSTQDGRFSAELRGPAALLERPAIELTSPECRARFGDERCRVDLAARTRITRVAEVVDARTLVVESAATGANAYGYGRLRWTDGANSGLGGAILRSVGAELTLRDPAAFAVAAGDRVEIVEGCDKLFATCAARFANAENFRGEPHLPGNDLLTRYPGAG
ncbi:MAG: DUF2163 domain-containing protein [Sphingomonadaceae bacterium]|nr:DUF2163 domain-containing protein [Sphingomonadaceae bacterium]